MNRRTHDLIVKVLAIHGIVAMTGSFVLLYQGKTVPVELLMVAGTIISGLTGHLVPPPKDQPPLEDKPTSNE
jgi:hypothetical protein